MTKILHFENTYYRVYYELDCYKDNGIDYIEYRVRIIIKFLNQANVNEKIVFYLLSDTYHNDEYSDNYNKNKIKKLLQQVLNIIEEIILQHKDVSYKLIYLQNTMKRKGKARVSSFVSCYRQRTNLLRKLFKWKLVEKCYIRNLDTILSS